MTFFRFYYQAAAAVSVCLYLRVVILRMYSIALLTRSCVLHTIKILYHFLIIKECHCKISNFEHMGRHALLSGDPAVQLRDNANNERLLQHCDVS
jgi:hypothetical protein